MRIFKILHTRMIFFDCQMLDKCSLCFYQFRSICIHFFFKCTSCIDLPPYPLNYDENVALIVSFISCMPKIYGKKYQITCTTLKLNICLNESQVYPILVTLVTLCEMINPYFIVVLKELRFQIKLSVNFSTSVYMYCHSLYPQGSSFISLFLRF